MKKLFLATIISLLLFASITLADIPRKISVQGLLSDPVSGKPYSVSYVNLTFAFYDQFNNLEDTRQINNVLLDDGFFNIEMSPNLDFDEPYYINVSVWNDTLGWVYLSPLINMTSVAYSYSASRLLPTSYDVVPASDRSYDLGNSTHRWDNLWLGGGLPGSGFIYDVFRINSPSAQDLWIGLMDGTRSIGFYDYGNDRRIFNYSGVTGDTDFFTDLNMNGNNICLTNGCQASWPTSYPGNCGADQVRVAGACRTIPDCDADTQTLNYDQSTDTWSCNADDTGTVADIWVNEAGDTMTGPLNITPSGTSQDKIFLINDGILGKAGFGIDGMGSLQIFSPDDPGGMITNEISFGFHDEGTTFTERMSIEEGGDVLIPSLAGCSGGSTIDTDVAGKLTCGSDEGVGGSGTNNKVAFWTGPGTLSYNNNFHWDNTNQRLGIGTTTPSSYVGLDVKNSESLGNRGQIIVDTYLLRDTTGNAYVPGDTAAWIDHNGGNLYIVRFAGPAGNQGIHLANPFGSTRMSIMEDGNVGIGTTTPFYRLDVDGTPGTISTFSGGDIYTNGAIITGFNLPAGSWAATFYEDIRVRSGGSDKATIDDSGNAYFAGDVGIGRSNPQAKLDVNGNIRIGNSASICNANHAGELRYYTACSGVGWRSSYLRACMQTGSSGYSWITIESRTWGDAGCGGSV